EKSRRTRFVTQGGFFSVGIEEDETRLMVPVIEAILNAMPDRIFPDKIFLARFSDGVDGVYDELHNALFLREFLVAGDRLTRAQVPLRVAVLSTKVMQASRNDFFAAVNAKFGLELSMDRVAEWVRRTRSDRAMLALDESLTKLDTALTEPAKQVSIDFRRLASGAAGYTQPDQVAKGFEQILNRLRMIVGAVEEVSSQLSGVKTVTQQQKTEAERLVRKANVFFNMAWQERSAADSKTRAIRERSPRAKKAYQTAHQVFGLGYAVSEKIMTLLQTKPVEGDRAMLAEQ
ncbi:MAG TPA: hypothetical protein VLJ10_04255, partial [Candidatus Bathyarchaeia archaeon]|nr:hypothetical protein [Candidatus Bathyarchaeia archaeon]